MHRILEVLKYFNRLSKNKYKSSRISFEDKSSERGRGYFKRIRFSEYDRSFRSDNGSLDSLFFAGNVKVFTLSRLGRPRDLRICIEFCPLFNR